ACGPLPNGVLKPDSGPDVVVVTDAPHVVTDATDATDEVESTTAGEAERKKRDIGAKGKVEKCKGAEVVITTDEAESSDGAFETVKKLESEVIKSIQDKFGKTVRPTKLKLSGGGDKLKLAFAVDAKCDDIKHSMLDTLFKLKTVQSVKTKCECQPPIYLSKSDFRKMMMKGLKKRLARQ
ncbi:hypothetical protein WUBG_09041, partial [Wuchereria bancrofti]